MKLTDSINAAITARFQQHQPRSFTAKVKLIMTCDAISPYPRYNEARSLLSQRGALAKRRRKEVESVTSQDDRFQQMKAARPDLYR